MIKFLSMCVFNCIVVDVWLCRHVCMCVCDTFANRRVSMCSCDCVSAYVFLCVFSECVAV